MKSPKVKMTIEEFQLADFPFGWKDEYYDGYAHYTPREHGILMKMPVENRQIKTFAEIDSISNTNFEKLTKLFYEAFVESVEFCDYTKSQIKKRASQNLKMFFDGDRGIPQLHLSYTAILPEFSPDPVGACLISKYKYGYKNEILFVHPKFQGKGIGTTLVATVLNELHKTNEKVFWSEHHICNEQSAKWHKKFGFMEETDIMTAKFRLNYLKHQFWRHERLGNTKKTEELKSLLKVSEREVKNLKELEEVDFDAAWLRWKYDY